MSKFMEAAAAAAAAMKRNEEFHSKQRREIFKINFLRGREKFGTFLCERREIVAS
jgi:hypothetical protein